jgi:hypothetical protein
LWISGFEAPTPLRAGTGDVLIIKGSGFGSVRGQVQFKNADDGGDTYTQSLDSIDYTWTNNTITVTVPSIIDNVDDTPGSGTFRIITNAGDTTESDKNNPLIIYYGVYNIVDDLNNPLIKANTNFINNGSFKNA